MFIQGLITVALGYLLGSVPSAYLLTRVLSGKDVRVEGDGNVGARNAGYVAGPLAGWLTLILDGAKGATTYYIARRWGGTGPVFYLTALAMVLGHCFPIWLGFHGGKGMAAEAGFLLQMWPYAATAGLAVVALAMQAVSFDLAAGLGAATFLALSFVEGNTLGGALFIVLFLGLTGLKKLVDLPYERRLRSVNHIQQQTHH